METDGTRKIRVRWVKSAIGAPKDHKDTIRALGFTKLNMVKEFVDSPQVRGMIAKVRHLVSVEEVKP